MMKFGKPFYTLLNIEQGIVDGGIHPTNGIIDMVLKVLPQMDDWAMGLPYEKRYRHPLSQRVLQEIRSIQIIDDLPEENDPIQIADDLPEKNDPPQSSNRPAI